LIRWMLIDDGKILMQQTITYGILGMDAQPSFNHHLQKKEWMKKEGERKKN